MHRLPAGPQGHALDIPPAPRRRVARALAQAIHALARPAAMPLAAGLAVAWALAAASPPASAQSSAAATPAPAPAAAAQASAAPAAPSAVPEPRPGAMAQVLGRSERLWVVRPAPGDTHAALAERFLGRADRAFWLGEGLAPTAGEPLVVPLAHPNPTGFQADAFQTVPVLAYHRFGSPAAPMVVTPEALAEQLQLLARGGYTVQRLAGLRGFLTGQEAWPARSVVITIDDAHESVYRLAFPLLREHGVPVTLFVASDVIGTRDALTWEQLQEMAATGLVDVQAHAKTQRNLTERAPGEADLAYRRGLELEVQTSRRAIEQRLPGVTVTHFAYPFGESNASVHETLQRNAFELGLTAQPGGNAFFSHPYQLRRTLVPGGQDIEAFKARLQLQQAMPKADTP